MSIVLVSGNSQHKVTKDGTSAAHLNEKVKYLPINNKRLIKTYPVFSVS